MLTITSDLEYDEAFANDATDSDVDSLSAALQDAIDALALTFYAAPDGFPQYAEVADFWSSTNVVKNLVLASDGSGTGFSTSTGIATDLYVGADQIFLFGTSDPNVVVGRIGNDSGGDVAVVLALNTHKDGSGNVDASSLGVAVYAPLVHSDNTAVDDADTLDLTGLVYLYDTFSTVAIVPFNDFSHVPSGQDAFALIGSSDPALTAVDLLASGFSGTTEGTVNVSTQGLGANAQTVDNGSSLRIDIVDANAADFAKADTSPEVHNAANISFQNHVDAIAAGFQLTQNNPTNKLASLTVSAVAVTGNHVGTAFVTNVFTDGALVKIDVGDVAVTDNGGNPIAGVSITQSGDGKSVLITGVPVNAHVDFTASSQFERFIITNTQTGPSDKTTFDVGGIHVSSITGGTGHESADVGAHTIFEDQGPSITAGTDIPDVSVSEILLGSTGMADFSGLFPTFSYGPDGAGTIDYDVSTNPGGADSGLIDTLTGNPIFLFVEDNPDYPGTPGASPHLIVGYEVSDPLDPEGTKGSKDFFIGALGSTVYLTQDRAVYHDLNTNDTTVSFQTDDLVQVIATISDSEGDTDSATAMVGTHFSITDAIPDMTGHADPADDEVTVANVAGSMDTNAFTLDPGSDQLGSYTIVGPADSSGDYQWSYDDSTHTSITETYKGSPLFSLELDSSNGEYKMTMLGSLPSTTDHLDTSDIKAGGPDTNFIDVGLLGSGNFARLSGFNGANPAAINESHAFVGVTNGNLDNGEAIEFQLFAPDGPDAGTDPDPVYFLGLNIGTKSAQTSTYSVDIDFVDPSKADIIGQMITVPKNTALSIDPAGSDLIQSITVHKVSGSALKLGLGQIDVLLPPVDTGFHFAAQLTDGDGDSASLPFNAFVDADGGGVDPLTVGYPA